MLKYLILPIATICLPAAGALGADMPAMKGTWQVKMEGIKIQKNGGPAPHNVDHVEPKSGKFTLDLTVTIDSQDGYSFSGKKVSARASEPVAGVIDFGNTHLSMVDSDGTTSCTVQSPNRLSCIYLEVNAVNSTTGRQIWTRKK
jgi:hypothetical protein